MENFQNFVSDIDKLFANNIEEKNLIFSIKELLEHNIKNDDFLLDIIEIILSDISKDKFSNWKNLPIYKGVEGKYVVQAFFWSNYRSNLPHQHKTWAVTGVMHNHINVYTYKWQDDTPNSTLIDDRSICAKRLDVGYLLPDCIHRVTNPSSSGSMTLHVFNIMDPKTGGKDEVIWYPKPRKMNFLEGAMDYIPEIINSILVKDFPKNQRSKILLEQLYSITGI